MGPVLCTTASSSRARPTVVGRLPVVGRRKQSARCWSESPRGPAFAQVTLYRFLDAMGDVVVEAEFTGVAI
jgi:hypothetical protein